MTVMRKWFKKNSPGFLTLDQFQVTESTEKLSIAPGQPKLPTQDEGEEHSVAIFLFKLILVPNLRLLDVPRRNGRGGIRKPVRALQRGGTVLSEHPWPFAYL